ncbi:hypothetical protein BDZ94DRAFT_1252402 [Collybia nuda]|uniref:Uncharacterized protein n=1 Tax=Collybia nuda TaxID=64659 RepID=A0A9P5YBK5_9AGAR|nr:hypothetical protein BDZ94DRAFT_1252402 [Collybia nuda]
MRGERFECNDCFNFCDCLNTESSKIQTKVFYTMETCKLERVSNILKQQCES